MNAFGRIDAIASEPGPYAGRSTGLKRSPLVADRCGSVHQAVTVCSLDAGGRIDRHAHAFEEALYVLGGELAVELDDREETLRRDEYAFVGVGVAHEVRAVGGKAARWLEVSAPQPGASGFEDTVFVRSGAVPVAPESGFARGRFDEAELPPPSGDILEGFGPANVTGASVKMLVDREFGASQLNLFVVQYVPGGAIEPHDHPFEEAYVFLSGEVEATLGGKAHTLRAGDWCWTGVREPHAFANRSDAPVRWLETQVPQPPIRHQARFFNEWAAG